MAENEINARVSNIRLRTWSLTIILVICLVFYYLVNVMFKNTIDWVDFIFIAIIQILTHTIYFPDGDLFGQKNNVFKSNRKAYNDKADQINEKHLFGKLREYCKIDFEERKKRYIENECSIIGITTDEFNYLSQLSEQEIKTLTKKEINGKFLSFSKGKRKRLYNLIFKVVPVKPNIPENIMSAIENARDGSIHNEAKAYKVRVYVSVILKATLLGLLFAYIGYTLRDGVGFDQIVSISMCICALFSTAVLSFTKGERYSRVFLSNYFLELSIFITGFFEWCDKFVDNNNQ